MFKTKNCHVELEFFCLIPICFSGQGFLSLEWVQMPLVELRAEEGGCSQWRKHSFLFSKFCRADLGITVNVFMRNTFIQAATQTKCTPKEKQNKQATKKAYKEPPHTPSLFLMCPHVKSGFYLTEKSELGDKKPRKLFLMSGKCCIGY